MKTILPFRFRAPWALVLILFLFANPCLHAQTTAAKPIRLDIKATKKRVEVERTQTNSKNLAEEKWIYNVEIHNVSFADQADLTIEYRCYKRDDKYGADSSLAKIPLKNIPGTEKIPSLANSAIYKFSTKEVKIDKDELKAGWYYTDNAKEKIKDSLYGIWLKVIKNGEVVSEFVSPPALKTKVDW